MGLIAEIYKSAYLGTCSNGGISERHDKVVLMNVDGPFGPTEDSPAVVLSPGNVRGTVKVVPAIQESPGEWVPVRESDKVGPMFGGSYVGTSDSRFSRAVEGILAEWGQPGVFHGAVALHDRYETPELARALSA